MGPSNTRLPSKTQPIGGCPCSEVLNKWGHQARPNETLAGYVRLWRPSEYRPMVIVITTLRCSFITHHPRRPRRRLERRCHPSNSSYRHISTSARLEAPQKWAADQYCPSPWWSYQLVSPSEFCLGSMRTDHPLDKHDFS